MPHYDLRCSECMAEFSVSASMTDRTEKRVLCPKCGSREVASVFKTAPYYQKSRSAPDCPNRQSCGVHCPHAHA